MTRVKVTLGKYIEEQVGNCYICSSAPLNLSYKQTAPPTHTNTRTDLIDKGGCKQAIFCLLCHLKGQADLLLQ